MSYAHEVAADRRLNILKALAETTGFGANATLIGRFLASIGHDVSHDLLQGELGWLAEQGFIGIEGDVSRLTRRGADVAAGRASHPGVRRLMPGE